MESILGHLNKDVNLLFVLDEFVCLNLSFQLYSMAFFCARRDDC